MWDNALKAPAPILLVTGWNEWTASVWETPGVVLLGRKTQKGQGHIVDEFNMDFNRDLEPMKGGYGDDYYWQFVANMRRYKGMSAAANAVRAANHPAHGPHSQWDGVRPLYHDAARRHGQPRLGRGHAAFALHGHQRAQRHRAGTGRAGRVDAVFPCPHGRARSRRRRARTGCCCF